MITVAPSSSKRLAEEKPHLLSGWQQKRFSSKHRFMSNHWSISKTHFFHIKHLRTPFSKRPFTKTSRHLIGIDECPRPLLLGSQIKSNPYQNLHRPVEKKLGLAYPFSQYDCNLFLLLVGGGCILSVSPCWPLDIYYAYSPQCNFATCLVTSVSDAA